MRTRTLAHPPAASAEDSQLTHLWQAEDEFDTAPASRQLLLQSGLLHSGASSGAPTAAAGAAAPPAGLRGGVEAAVRPQMTRTYSYAPAGPQALVSDDPSEPSAEVGRLMRSHPGFASWVTCAWQLKEAPDGPAPGQRWHPDSLSALITQTARLAPGQVDVITSSNVTIGVRVAGAELGAKPAATAKGLRAAFAVLARGFDPTLLVITPLGKPKLVTSVVVAPGAPAVADGAATPEAVQAAVAAVAAGGAAVAPAAKAAAAADAKVAPPAQNIAITSLPTGEALIKPIFGPTFELPPSRQLLGADGDGPPEWHDGAQITFTGLAQASVPALIKALTTSCGALEPDAPLQGECVGMDLCEVAA
jgi:hypothetical protein